MKYLTKSQYEVLKCIDELIQEQGIPPSFREIRDRLGLSSNATVHTHVHDLCEKGYISFKSKIPRSIRITGPYSREEIIQRGSNKKSQA